MDTLNFGLCPSPCQAVGQDCAVGTATRYGLDGPGSNTAEDEIFHTCQRRLRGTSSLLHKGYRVPFQRVKRPGRGVDHPPLLSAEVKERVELIYSPFGPSWLVLGRALPFTFNFYHVT